MFRSAFHLHGEYFRKAKCERPTGGGTVVDGSFVRRLSSLCPEQLKQSRKENSVLLASQHRNQIRLWIRRCVRLEMKARLLGRPSNRGSSAEEVTLKGCAVFSICAIARCRSTPRQKKPWRERGKLRGSAGQEFPTLGSMSWQGRGRRRHPGHARAGGPANRRSRLRRRRAFTGIIQNTPLRSTCTL